MFNFIISRFYISFSNFFITKINNFWLPKYNKDIIKSRGLGNKTLIHLDRNITYSTEDKLKDDFRILSILLDNTDSYLEQQEKKM